MKQPDGRLLAAADLVRQGAVLADIGTDHALLPVFLCRVGKIRHAIASDVGKGPLAAARRQVEEAGLSDRIRLHLADGLDGLDGEKITDIAICGMGGELIVDILSRAPFVRDAHIRLILQPMTHARDLRCYLAREGFAIVEERLATAAGKAYFVLAAEYTGTPCTLTPLAAALGADNLSRRARDEVFLQILDKEIKAQTKKCEGLRAGGVPDEEQEAYLGALLRYKEEMGL